MMQHEDAKRQRERADRQQLAPVALKAREQMADLEGLAPPHGVATEQEAAHQRWEYDAGRDGADDRYELRDDLQQHDQQEYADECPPLLARERPRVGDPTPTVAGRHAAPFGEEVAVRQPLCYVLDVSLRGGVRVVGHDVALLVND